MRMQDFLVLACGSLGVIWIITAVTLGEFWSKCRSLDRELSEKKNLSERGQDIYRNQISRIRDCAAQIKAQAEILEDIE